MNKLRLIALAVCVSMVFTGCFKSEADESKEEAYKTVKVEEINLKKSDQTLTYSGVVKSKVEKKVSFKASGRVKEMLVKEGDYVTAGQSLAVIDTTDIELQAMSLSSQLSAAEKDIAKAKETYDYNSSEYNKIKTLFEGGVVSASQHDASALAYEQSKLGYEMSKDSYNRLVSEKRRIDEMFSEGVLKADQAGIVDALMVEEYEMISSGMPVITLRSEDQMVVTYVTGEDRLKLQAENQVALNISGKEIVGVIFYIDDAADPQTHSYRVEIGISDKKITNGSIANIEFVVGQFTGVWIPLQSIQTTTIDFVYLINDGRAEKRSIQIIEVKGDDVLVEGLEKGEQLIVSGMKSLVEGMLVKAME